MDNNDENDFLPISALQHLLFCERQCVLIHLEREWQENILTIEGKQMHEKVDKPDGETRKEIRIVSGLLLSSSYLKLTGKADMVEFRQTDENDVEGGIQFGKKYGLPSALRKGRWKPYPVEYKRGKPKPESCDEVQLCAQAMCLEEMCKVTIERGALFYGKTCHRHEIIFSPALREETEHTAERLHHVIGSKILPKAVYEKKCERCSLMEICMPIHSNKSARAYLEKIFNLQE